VNEQEYRCVNADCRKIITVKNSYVSKSKYNFNGRMSICKDCVTEEYKEYYRKFGDVKRAIWLTCRKLDIPFIDDRYSMVETQLNDKEYVSEKAFGVYMQKLYSFKQVEGEPSCFEDGNINIKFSQDETLDTETELSLIDKWGKYSARELNAFEKKYNTLKNNYPEKTALHTEALMNYVRYRCKEELATADGEVKDAESWSKMAAKAATDAKINPSQLSQADLQGGLNSFSEISQAAEREVDIIKILPEFKYRPNDAVDFIIWNYVNYTRKAKGLPTVEYSDIYKFYDEKKKEYIEQYGDPYGIFKDDPTEINRGKIEKFIQIPKGVDDDA
jgi:hypothetical protein